MSFAQEKAMRIFATDHDVCIEIAKLMQAKNASMAPRLKMGMTRKQQELYDFIVAYIGANDGVAPSYEEMKNELGLASKSGVHRLMNALEERGMIQRLPYRARAIKIMDEASLVRRGFAYQRDVEEVL
jgi:repressor LexA